MNERIDNYLQKNNIINKAQIGFQRGNRTTDHILTLKSIVNKYIYDNKSNLYACFIDFKKAFDSVNHQKLFYKLRENKINGKLLNLLQSIYKQSQCALKINNKLTQFFNYEKGVIQGNPLSPLLFNIYINDLFQKIEEANNTPITLDGRNNISALMFADDLIIFSTSKRGLQSSLNALHSYSKIWDLEVNMKKTKCMSFSKGNKKEKDELTFNNQKIQFINEFKYLGITINRKGSFTPTLDDLSNKATNAIYSLNSKINIKLLSPSIILKLFDFLICPILLYGSEVWEPYLNQNFEKWDSNSIEKVHLHFMKRLLGVNRSTTNVLIRGELGRYSLQEKCIIKNMRYIKYVKSKDESTLVKQAYNYEMSKSENRTSINNTIENLNKRIDEIEGGHVDLFKTKEKKLKNYINRVFEKEWTKSINNSSKSDTYKLFKLKPSMETYLKDIKDVRYIKTLTKFRLSDHKLMIAEGRKCRPIINRSERLCLYCNKLEDEIHFLIECNRYKYERYEMYDKIGKFVPNFKTIPDSKSKFIFLMSQENVNITKILALNIHRWNQIREIQMAEECKKN